MRFLTQALLQDPTVVALDGAEVRVLPVLAGGSLAHCTWVSLTILEIA